MPGDELVGFRLGCSTSMYEQSTDIFEQSRFITVCKTIFIRLLYGTKYGLLLVLQQTHHIVTHTSPHKVTSSNIYQIKAKRFPNQKMHDATSVCRGVNFYESLKKGTHTNK